MDGNVTLNFDAEAMKKYKEALIQAEPLFRKIKRRQPKD